MITDVRPLRESIASAVGRLVSVRHFDESSIVSVPVAYPSGALAAVHISVSGSKCFISDCALGLREAEMSGAGDFFGTTAKDAAYRFGVGFDGASVFAAEAPLDRIEGAIIAVANASASAVSRAVVRASETKERHVNNELFDRVSDIFGRQRVSRTQNISGREETWEAHNVVSIDGRVSVFEFISHSVNSVASKYLMFSDISAAQHPPSLNSVVYSIEKMPPKSRLLHDISNVIEISSPREAFLRHARAA